MKRAWEKVGNTDKITVNFVIHFLITDSEIRNYENTKNLY